MLECPTDRRREEGRLIDRRLATQVAGCPYVFALYHSILLELTSFLVAVALVSCRCVLYPPSVSVVDSVCLPRVLSIPFAFGWLQEREAWEC